jgi:hypothetical protein
VLMLVIVIEHFFDRRQIDQEQDQEYEHESEFLA